MRQFDAFCHEEGIHPLQAITQSIVCYTAWLGLQGTVVAASLQENYSAINKFFRDHQQQPIAVGELLADERRGLEMHHDHLFAADSRLPSPAHLAVALLDAAAKSANTIPSPHP
jgi:cephalosporin-C deacetylase-like acetyl esterase